jgi:hypothetical protein
MAWDCSPAWLGPANDAATPSYHIISKAIVFDMDLSDPTRAVGATLDGAVLAVLASSGRPLTVGQVAGQAARGSEIGIRRTLARLVEQGTVRATLMGRNQVHELNRDHIAAPVAELLAQLRPRLWDRFRGELADWRVRPLYACVFGSAARGAGDTTSDIDLLLVHPPLPGEKRPTGLGQALLAELAVARTDPESTRLWEEQVDRLRVQAHSWTGNALQVVDLSLREWGQPAREHRALFAEVQRDGVELAKARTLSFWSTPQAADGN